MLKMIEINNENLQIALCQIKLGFLCSIYTADNINDISYFIVQKGNIEDQSLFIEILSLSKQDSSSIIHVIDEYKFCDVYKVNPRPLFYELKQSFLLSHNFDYIINCLNLLKNKANLTYIEYALASKIVDAYVLASENIYGDITRAQDHISMFLNVYSDYSFSKYKTWNMIDLDVNTNLELLSESLLN